MHTKNANFDRLLSMYPALMQCGKRNGRLTAHKQLKRDLRKQKISIKYFWGDCFEV